MTTILPTYSCMHHFNYFHTLSNFLFEFYGCSSNFNISFNLFILIMKIFYNFNHFLFIVLKLFGINIILVDEFIQFFLQVRDSHNFEKLIFLNIRAQTTGILNIKYFSGNLTVPVTLDIRLVSWLIESWSFRNKISPTHNCLHFLPLLFSHSFGHQTFLLSSHNRLRNKRQVFCWSWEFYPCAVLVQNKLLELRFWFCFDYSLPFFPFPQSYIHCFHLWAYLRNLWDS